jgi:LysR family glycine cleavage system transcriptional activator
MKRNLPPLNSLKAFEAAGRHMSFSKAAEELSVTPAAISHQVKTLEDHLGIQLFRRLPHGLLLTDAGQTCLPQLGRSFDGLAAAIDDLRSREEKGVLTVSVMPSLAAKRLLPALFRFQSQHSEIDLHIWATTSSADFARDNVDVAIRYGLGEWPGLRVDSLRAEELFPVCSPALLDGPHPLSSPDNLRHHTLLHDLFWTTNFVGEFPDWSTWLKIAGVKDVDLTRGLALTPSDMVSEAAIAGRGVALGRSVLVELDLAEGRLVKPFDLSISVEFAYYVVCPESRADRPKVAAFRDWILEEISTPQMPADQG